MSSNFKGVDTSNDGSALSLGKDMTPMPLKMKRFIASEGFWLVLLFIIIFPFIIQPVNFLIEFLIVVAIFLGYLNVSSESTLPYKKPETSGDAYDLNERDPSNGKPTKPKGITFFGNELNTNKEVWFTNSDVRTHCLIFGTTGAGKALKTNEKVLTPNGWVVNKDINVGDLVSTPDGSSRVTGVFPQGELELYRIKFKDGRFIDVSADHLWEVSCPHFEAIALADGYVSKSRVVSTLVMKKLLKSSSDVIVPMEKNYSRVLGVKSVKRLYRKEQCQCIKIEDPRGLFITKDFIVTHNTEALLSICVNTLNQASGLIFIDGKGDNSLWAKVFALVAARGRLDDLYLINYMTSSVNLDQKTTEKISNTMNPFATGNSDSLTELIVSLLPDSGGDGMWKGRASVFMGALLKALVYKRNEGEILLDINTIRKYFTLSKITELSSDLKVPEKYRDGLIEYVINLPGYIEPTAQNNNPDQPETVAEQHGYITMQYTETFGLLSDVYGHIMKTQIAEVDFLDIVVNRRILVVLLPALEKSKQNLGNLGRIIIASIKNMMATTLGSKVEGDIEEVIETKPTNAPSPFLTIFDEYGYYSVEGAAVMPAQARGLGFFMIFAGQDFQAFKGGSEEEAYSIIANLAIKLCMKLEDPTETLKIFQDAAGEESVAEMSGFERDVNSVTGDKYMNATSLTVNKKNIINIRDLRDQDAGAAHLLFRDTTRRLRIFYANPVLMAQSRVNTFLEVEPPAYETVREFKFSQKLIDNKFNEILEDNTSYLKITRRAIDVIGSPELDNIFRFAKIAKNYGTASMRGVFAFASYAERIKIVDNKIIQEIRENIDLTQSEGFQEAETDSSGYIVKESKDDTANKDVDGILNKSVDRLDIIEELREIVDSNNKKISGIEDKTFKVLDRLGIDFFDLADKISEIEDGIVKTMAKKGVMRETKASREVTDLVVEKVLQELNLGAIPVRDKMPDAESEKIDNEVKDLIDEIISED
jgi:intracellular multiplication protein IcmO